MEQMEQKNLEEKPTEVGPNDEKKSMSLFFIGIAVALGIIVLAVLGLASYRALHNMSSDRFTLGVARAIHLPAGFVSGSVVSYSDFMDDVSAVNKFYTVNAASQGGQIPSPAEIRKSVWDRLVKNSVLDKLSKGSNLSVNNQEINDEFAKFVTEVGSEAKANQMITDTYGWNQDQFKAKIIRPYLLQNKLSSVTSTAEMLAKDSLKQAQDVLAQVKEGKKTFEDLAKQYSSDGSAQQGGDLGWFGTGVMVKEFEDAVSKMEPGQVSELVKTQFGLHIIKLEEKRKSAKGAVEWHARHILIPAGDFNKYLDDKIKAENVWKWIKI